MFEIKRHKNSSIELLRIISMLFIVVGHYAAHGGYVCLLEHSRGANIAYLECIQLFGNISCSIFSLITGYFMIDSKVNNLTQLKKISKLLVQFLFYSLLALLLLISIKVFGFFDGDVNLALNVESIFNCLFPIFYGNWYVRTYIYFMFFVPFLNTLINNVNKKNHIYLLLVSFLIWAVLPQLTGMKEIFGYFGIMFVMYLTGSYIKKYFVYNERNRRMSMILCAACFITIILFRILLYCFDANNIEYLHNLSECIMSLLSETLAVSSFILFSSFYYSNHIVDLLGSTTVGIYLFHDNDYFRYIIWNVISPNIMFYDNPFFHSIIKVIIVFIVSAVIEIFRQLIIGNKIDRFIDSKFDILFMRENAN